jgi:hypothetical protein
MSAPPISSPRMKTCGIVGQPESAESSWRICASDVDGRHWRARVAQRFQRPRRVPAHGPLRRALHEQGHRLVRDDLLDLLAHLAH